MTETQALIWTIIVGFGLLYMGHYLTRKLYETAWRKLMRDLDKEGYLNLEKVNQYLENKYSTK